MAEELLLTPIWRDIVRRAEAEAVKLAHAEISPEHLFIAMLRRPDGLGTQVLNDLGIDLGELKLDVYSLMEQDATISLTECAAGAGTTARAPNGRFGVAAQDLETSARAIAAEEGHKRLGSEHLLLALLRAENSPSARALGRHKLTYAEALRRIRLLLADSLCAGADPELRSPRIGSAETTPSGRGARVQRFVLVADSDSGGAAGSEPPAGAVSPHGLPPLSDEVAGVLAVAQELAARNGEAEVTLQRVLEAIRG